MKEEQDVIGTTQPKDVSKIKKYIRIALIAIFMVSFAILIVAAVMRRYGS